VPKRDLIIALLVSWGIVSAAAVGLCVAPYAVDSQTLHGIFPPCPQLAKTGHPCPVCGMTRAFIAIAAGDPDAARRYNSFSIALYDLFLANAALFGLVLSTVYRRRFHINAAAKKTLSPK